MNLLFPLFNLYLYFYKKSISLALNYVLLQVEPLISKVKYIEVKEHKVNISSHSIVSSGLPQERNYAIAEYIWNGFDAGASKVIVNFDANDLGYISSFSVSDNGKGIDYDRLKYSFGSFLDSPKRHLNPHSSYVRGKKGKGRFSFTSFADHAYWQSNYQKGGKNYAFDLYIDKKCSQKFSTNNHYIVMQAETGTVVTFSGLSNISGNLFDSSDFEMFLAQEFGWFLYLNRGYDFAIYLNNKKIDYTELIATSNTEHITLTDEEGKEEIFDVTLIRWKQNIGDRSYYYYLDHQKKEIAKELTTYNNNAVGFYHSVFVESYYFDDFVLSDNDMSKSLFGRNRHHSVYRKLLRVLNNLVGEFLENYVSNTKVEKRMKKFRDDGCFGLLTDNRSPSSDKTEQLIRKLYCIDPRLFERLRKEQAQLLISSLSIIIESAATNKILSILDSVSPMTDKQRKQIEAILL